MITPDNKIVHGLWIGNRLSFIEMLTLQSFIHHGHDFHLWVYEPIDNIPEGVTVRDANGVIPAKDIIVRKYNDPVTGVGKGSVGAPFSDIFRYKLLYKYGGWWVDMDMTCLKPLQIEEPYFFRDHLFLDVIGNVMKCPKGSELMLKTYTEASQTCDENTLDWLLPNKILNRHIRELGLSDYIRTGISNRDEWPETKKFIRTHATIPGSWCIIHWMNEEWRMNGLEKDHMRLNRSTLGDLVRQYRIQVPKANCIRMVRNEIRLARPFRSYQLTHVPSLGILRFLYRLRGIILTLYWLALKRPFNKAYWYVHGHVKYYVVKYLSKR